MRRKKLLAVVLAAAMAFNMTGVSAAAQPAVGLSVFGKSVFGGLFGGDSSDKKSDDSKSSGKQTDGDQTTADESTGDSAGTAADQTDAAAAGGTPEASAKEPASSAKTANNVTLDIGRGDIVINKSGISAFDTEGNEVTKTSSQYVITGSSEEHSIQIGEGANANIVLSNVSIIRSAAGESPFWIADDSSGNVTVTLQGTNTLQGGSGAAAIQKNCNHTGSYDKCGRLDITCGNNTSSHVCDSNCGILNATGTDGAAAIGGAAGRGSSNINLKGGMITASGGVGGASGGVGTDVDIEAGMVNAGTINGKDGSASNLMNGDTLVFADSAAGLNAKRGILYQNGAGTVYGNVNLSEGLADYLPDGSELTIPAGATLTVGDVGIVPETVNVIGRERIKVDATPTPEPTEDPAAVPAMQAEEAPEEVMAMAEENARAWTYGKSSTIVHVFGKRNGAEAEITTGQNVHYGETLRIEATVNLSTDPSVSSDITPGNNEVEFTVNGTPVGAESLGAEADGTYTVFRTYEVRVTPGQTIEIGATYHGNSHDSSTATKLSFKVDPGSLHLASPASLPTYEGTAGRSLDESKFDQYLQNNTIVIQDEGGNSVKGTWNWNPSYCKSDIFYPVTSQLGDYNCIFIPDDSNYVALSSNIPVKATVAGTPKFGDESVKAEYDASNRVEPWYNEKCGEVQVTLSGYSSILCLPGSSSACQIGVNTPVSLNEWKDANSDWKAAVSGKVTIPEKFFDGNYRLYIKDADGLIYEATIENLKIDKIYPVIKEAKFTPTANVINTFFQVINEGSGSGSGIAKYDCHLEPRMKGTMVSPSFNATDNKPPFKSAYTENGEIRFAGLNTSEKYDAYVQVTDKAGNTTQYMTRIIEGYINNGIVSDDYPRDRQGTALNPNEDPSENDDLKKNVEKRYGFECETDLPAIDATLELETIRNGQVVKGSIIYGDIIRANAKVDNGGVGEEDYIYTWYRAPKDAQTDKSLIEGAENTRDYQTKVEDIDYVIFCQVTTKKTSSLKEKGTTPLWVEREDYPEEDAPVEVSVNNTNHTYTFSGVTGGLRGAGYEYTLDGENSGNWIPVDEDWSIGNNQYVINVGEATIPAGQLCVRAKVSDIYKASKPCKNSKAFVSSLQVTLEGDTYYGETLKANVNVDSSMVAYKWSYEDGKDLNNYVSTYDLKKEDIGKKITVTASLLDNPQINSPATSSTIRKRPLTVSANAVQKQYDGTTKAEAAVEIKGRINNDDITATAEVEFADKNAGTNKPLKITNVKLVGNDREYYSEPDSNISGATGTILPRQLTLNMTAQDKVYDGNANAVVSFTTEALPGDSITVTGSGEFADKNVGTNKTVTSKDVQVGGTDAANYTAAGSTATATASITKKDIELEGITVADKYYDNTTDAVIAASFKGAVDEVQYTYKAAFDTPNVGKDKRVTATVTLTGDSATNYNLLNDSAVGTGNIVKALAPYEEANIPQNLTGVQGKKLSSVYIGNGFKWKDPNTIMETVGRHTYPAIYNPDASQYGDREIELEVLVQCSKHTWGEWTITQEPTKEEQGERQRICGVCGYTEVEIIPRAPYVSNEEDRVGWGDIIQAINNASSGTEIPVTMNGTETLPASVQEALQGRDVSLVLQMGDGITWTIRGEDITASVLKDINMALTVFTDNIPSDVIDSVAKGKTAIQLHLAYSGEFGFVATLRVPLGDEFAGIPSTLYYYNPTRERLEQMDKNKITADGIGRYDFTHASDYVVIVDKQADVQGGDTPSGNGNNGNNGNNNGNNGNNGTSGTVTPIAPTASPSTTSGVTTRPTSANNIINIISSNGAKTEDSTPIMLYVILLLAGAGAATGAVIYKRKKKTKE